MGISVALSVAVLFVPTNDLSDYVLAIVALMVPAMIFVNLCAAGYRKLRASMDAYDAMYWGLSAFMVTMYVIKTFFLSLSLWVKLVPAVFAIVYLIMSVQAYKKIGKWEKE